MQIPKVPALLCCNFCLHYARTQAFKALQTAYIRLLQNPFYTPDDYASRTAAGGRDPGQITSKKFTDEVQRIGELWRPGVTNL